MRLISYRRNGESRLGMLIDDAVIDLNHASTRLNESAIR